MGDCPLFPDDYQPRDPKASPLYRLLDAHYNEFKAVYEDRFRKDYGYWRPVVDEVVAKFLECGDPHYGVTRIACEDCDASYFVPFSCACRGFCPSCTQRKVLELAVLLEEDILRPTAHRHWIWTIPRMLRVHYRNHRKLLPKLCRCAWRALCEFIHAAYDRDDIFPGAVFVPQSFGSLGRWNAHCHALISDTCYDRQGNEYPMPDFTEDDMKLLEEFFSQQVFQMMLDEGVIEQPLVDKLRSWKHSGFSVYCKTRLDASDTDGRRKLAEYIARAPFSLERMTVNEDASVVLYHGEHFHPGLKRNFDVSDPLEWIARITAHIPDKGAKSVIYYGAYAQAWRGRERRQGILPAQPIDNAEQDSDRDLPHRRQMRRKWAFLLQRAWGVDALKCPKCGGRMRALAVITDPTSVSRILKHLGIDDESRAPPPAEPEVRYEPDPDYVPWEDDVPVIQIA